MKYWQEYRLDTTYNHYSKNIVHRDGHALNACMRLTRQERKSLSVILLILILAMLGLWLFQF